MLELKDLTDAIIGAAIDVHRETGPGLLESTYRCCLCHELSRRQINFRCELSMPVSYKGTFLECGYRIDLLIEDQVIVELKSVEKLLPIHEAQFLTDLKLSDKRVGLLFNFNVLLLKDGIIRRVL